MQIVKNDHNATLEQIWTQAFYFGAQMFVEVQHVVGSLCEFSQFLQNLFSACIKSVLAPGFVFGKEKGKDQTSDRVGHPCQPLLSPSSSLSLPMPPTPFPVAMPLWPAPLDEEDPYPRRRPLALSPAPSPAHSSPRARLSRSRARAAAARLRSWTTIRCAPCRSTRPSSSSTPSSIFSTDSR